LLGPGRVADPMAEQWRAAVEPVKAALTAMVMWRYTECAPWPGWELRP
jgi:hypothetical protein